MNSKLIYLDTNIWNRLVDQKIEPKAFLRALARKDASVVLSGQTVYELARTFLSSIPHASVRGKELFRYVKNYIAAEIPCAHDTMQILHGEIEAIHTGAARAVAFYGPTEYASLRSEVEKLSRGTIDKRAEDFIAGRKRFSQSSRAEQRNHFEGKGHVRDLLKAVSDDQLKGWLDKEMLSDSGSAILASHLLRMYDGVLAETALRTSHELLRIPASRIAKGVVRADLYFNWRCANRGSTPSDLTDDLYHVLNASYCGFYATAEPKQAEYASLLLSAGTLVAIHDDQTRVDSWLLTLL